MRLVPIVLIGLLASSASALAADVQFATRDVPLRAGLAQPLSDPGSTRPFNMVALRWLGSGTVAFRTRSLQGRWSSWRAAAPEPEDGPDQGSRERLARAGWRLGNPFWTGSSSRIQYRRRGDVRSLRAQFVWSPPPGVPARALASAGSPLITRRAGWGANERSVRGPTIYSTQMRLAVVHHTAGAAGYSPAEAAAIVRGIATFHTRGNGWNDIGYNFLIDRFGRVYEGRRGGVDRNVVGAHAAGFNLGSVGIALIGSYNSRSISAAARESLIRLLSWRLDVAHVDPLARVASYSEGNYRYPAGSLALLRTISGHRDTGPTSCPGGALYSQLGAIALEVSKRGLPKVYDPRLRGAPGKTVAFGARISGAIPWRFAVTSADGDVVSETSGTSKAVAATWDARIAPAGRYTWALDAGPDALPVTGSLQSRLRGLTLAGAVKPRAITPNGDGVDDSAALSFRLGAPALVRATVRDRAGTTVGFLFAEQWPAGRHVYPFSHGILAEGLYRLELSATGESGKVVLTRAAFAVSRALAGFTAPPAFSPNDDGRLDRLELALTLTAATETTVGLLRARRPVATLQAGLLRAGSHTFSWDGFQDGLRVPDGRYEAFVRTRSAAGAVTTSRSIVVDTAPPRLEFVSREPLQLRVNEPAFVTVTLDGRAVTVDVPQAGLFTVPTAGPFVVVEALAEDRAGNFSLPLSPL